jgi:hypothetical protein
MTGSTTATTPQLDELDEAACAFSLMLLADALDNGSADAVGLEPVRIRLRDELRTHGFNQSDIRAVQSILRERFSIGLHVEPGMRRKSSDREAPPRSKPGAAVVVALRSTDEACGSSLENPVPNMNGTVSSLEGGAAMATKKSGGGKVGRSAITGRFVKQSTVKSNPTMTVNRSRGKSSKKR